MMYSRRVLREKQLNMKRSVSFIVFSIIAIVLFIFFGINSLVKLSSFVYDLKKSSLPVDANDTTPPPPPIFDTPPETTNAKDVTLSGTAESGATLILVLNKNEKEIIVNNEGQFSYNFVLTDGENKVSAYVRDSSNNKSQQSKTYTVIYDNTPPELTVSKPSDGESFYGSKQKNISIDGKTEENCQVSINGRHLILSQDNSFSARYNLSDGENILLIKSEDKAGNKTEKTFTVTYNP